MSNYYSTTIDSRNIQFLYRTIIVEKYGKEAFEINDNYIMVTIPFDEEVMATLNVGVNDGVNDAKKLILEELLKNPQLTSVE